MKLYGSPVSPYVARVQMAVKAKGIDVAVESPPGGGIKSPEYLAMNPMGKMPTLDDAGTAVPESGIILEYLEDAGGGKSLLPQDAKGRARVRTVARIVDLYLVAQSGGFFRNMNPAQRNQAEVDAAIAGTKNALGYLEFYTDATGPYLCGKQLTIADCTLLPTLLMTVKFLLPAHGQAAMLASFPKLNRWYEAMLADAQWSGFCKDYCDGFAAFIKSRAG
jgi:glutathione S-transferase